MKKNISKSDWLTHALDVLESEGLRGVRIERLARDLGVAKAGFYWHFKDRQDLYQNMLQYWANEFTTVVTADPDMQEGEPEQRLYKTMVAIQGKNLAKYDLAIRDWAAHDATAAKIIRRVYKNRLDFVRDIFSDLGFRSRQLEMRTRLFVCYQSWEATMFVDLTKKERLKLLQLQHKLLITK